jgi:cytosine/adenosine deaminase-related metal-dependent hydrolase
MSKTNDRVSALESQHLQEHLGRSDKYPMVDPRIHLPHCAFVSEIPTKPDRGDHGGYRAIV